MVLRPRNAIDLLRVASPPEIIDERWRASRSLRFARSFLLSFFDVFRFAPSSSLSMTMYLSGNDGFSSKRPMMRSPSRPTPSSNEAHRGSTWYSIRTRITSSERRRRAWPKAPARPAGSDSLLVCIWSWMMSGWSHSTARPIACIVLSQSLRMAFMMWAPRSLLWFSTSALVRKNESCSFFACPSSFRPISRMLARRSRAAAVTFACSWPFCAFTRLESISSETAGAT